MDGALRIKTRIDNSEVDKDIKNLEDKMKKLQKDNQNQSNKEREFQAEITQYKQMCAEADRYNEELKRLEQTKKEIFQDDTNLAVSVDSKEYSNIKTQIEQVRSKYEQITKEIDKQSPKIEKVYNQLEKVKTKQAENNEKIKEYNNRIEEIQYGNINSSVNTIAKSTTNLIKQIMKWGIALFSVRSAYNFISRLANTYLSENEDVANKISSIWGTIAEIIGPVVEYISNIVAKAVGYLAVFIKALTGTDIIANRNAKAIKKQALAQKELNKQMETFDEANVLQDTQSEISSGAQSAIFETPELNPEIVEKIQEFADKVKELKERWDELSPVMKTILALLGTAGLLGLLTGKVGLVGAIGSVILALDGLARMFSGDSSQAIVGFMELIGVAGLIGLLTGNGGLALAIGAIAIALLGLSEMINGDVTDAIQGMILLIGGAGLAGYLLGGTTGLGVGVAISTVITLLRGLSDLFSGDATKAIKGFIEIIVGTAGAVFAFQLLTKGITGLNIPLMIAVIGIIALAAGIALVVQNWGNMSTFEKAISIFGLLAIAAATAAAAVGALQSAWTLGAAAVAIVAGVAMIAYAVSQANKRAQENIPQLAVGGIVNNPGRGVPVGGGQAIAGEAGKEGVLPLTDSSTMAELGKEIGKWITVNNVTNTYLDSKLIQRKQEKNASRLAFATNGGG